jgi:hypothetical protein
MYTFTHVFVHADMHSRVPRRAGITCCTAPLLEGRQLICIHSPLVQPANPGGRRSRVSPPIPYCSRPLPRPCSRRSPPRRSRTLRVHMAPPHGIITHRHMQNAKSRSGNDVPKKLPSSQALASTIIPEFCSSCHRLALLPAGDNLLSWTRNLKSATLRFERCTGARMKCAAGQCVLPLRVKSHRRSPPALRLRLSCPLFLCAVWMMLHPSRSPCALRVCAAGEGDVATTTHICRHQICHAQYTHTVAMPCLRITCAAARA